MKLQNILIAGNPTRAGAVLVRKCLKTGHTVKTQEGYIYRRDIFSGYDIDTICNDNLNIIDDDLGNNGKLSEIVTGCNVIVTHSTKLFVHLIYLD